MLHQVAAAQTSHAAEVRQRNAAKNLLQRMNHYVADGFPETSVLDGLMNDLSAFGRTEVTDETRSQVQSDVKNFLVRWEDAFSRLPYMFAISDLNQPGEQLRAIRTLALENGWQWSDAIPADTSPPPDKEAMNAWRKRAFPSLLTGWDWHPEEPNKEGLDEAVRCARRVQEYRTDINNAWQRLRDR